MVAAVAVDDVVALITNHHNSA